MTGGDECAAAFLADCEDLWVEFKPSVSLCDCFAPLSSLTVRFAGEWLPTGKVAKRDLSLSFVVFVP